MLLRVLCWLRIGQNITDVALEVNLVPSMCHALSSVTGSA